jgi:hypothetical protein
MRSRIKRDFLESYQTILVLKHAVADTEFYVELARDMVEAECRTVESRIRLERRPTWLGPCGRWRCAAYRANGRSRLDSGLTSRVYPAA